eukprot:TRINITY_DN473_c0_g1_i2.p1 TRINITY_DN473_c0_g1~~TRINITY_DN473_c0_g1_i2.p1  ORF type:complete len:930 (-),score=107.72 TRINITY_DN473_c0_g1_i2:7371-10160(-)
MANLKAVAIKLAPYFENSGSETSPWTWELLRIMGVCKTVEYRVSSIKSISISSFTFPYILNKARDINEQVRCAVYLKLLEEKVMLERLTKIQKYDLLLNGLMDYNEKVRITCGQYLRANMNWLVEQEMRGKGKAVPEYRKFKSDAGDFTDLETEPVPLMGKSKKPLTGPEKAVRLMKLFNVKALKNSDEHSICLKHLAEFLINECDLQELLAFFKENVVPSLMGSGEVNEEGLVLMRVAVDSCSSSSKGKYQFESETVLPQATTLDSIVAHLLSENNVFVLHEVLTMFPQYNYTEPTINQTLVQILDKFIRDVSTEGLPPPADESINPILYSMTPSKTGNMENEYLELVQDQLDLHRRDVVVRTMGDLVHVVLKVMQQLMAGEDNRFKNRLMMYIADLQEQIDEVREKKEVQVKLLESQEGLDDKLLEDPQELFMEESFLVTRALKLAVYLLQTCTKGVSEEILEDLNNSLVSPVLQSESGNEFVKFLATQYLGLYSLLDIEKSKALFPFFKALIKDISTFQTLQGIASLKAIFDIFLAHAKELSHVETPRKNPSDPMSTLHELQTLMYTPNNKLRLLVYENYTKLIFCDKIPSPERFLVLLFLVLSDPMENESEVNGIKQIITLALKSYTKLSINRTKYLCNAIAIFTLLWMKANADPGKVSENTILSHIMKCQYVTVISYLIYLLTHRYTGGDTEPRVAEVIIQIIKVIITHVEIMQYIQCTIAICLRFIELDNISKTTQIVLYKHWMEFIKRARYKEKEYYTFGCILRGKILQKEVVEEEREMQVIERTIDEVAAGMSEEIRKLCEKLEKRYNKVESISGKLFQEFNELLIDPVQGCVKIQKAQKPLYQTGILTSQVRGRRSSRLGTILETPRRFHNYNKGVRTGTSQKKRRDTEEVDLAKRPRMEYNHLASMSSKDVIKEETKEE